MKLTKEDIQTIDNFLIKREIKHLDIRVELLDHLASEFEEHSEYGLIEDYLLSKTEFVIEFNKKQKKSIHWSYQKLLWVQFTKFFYQPKFIALLSIIGVIGYAIFNLFSIKIFSFTWLAILAVLILYPIYYQIRYAKTLKKVQSMQSLFTITSLPSFFLYLFGGIKDFLVDNPIALIIYFSISLILGLSSVIVIENNRKNIFEKYRQLVSEQ